MKSAYPSRKWPKRIVGHAIGVAAWGVIIMVIPNWSLFSVQTALVITAFILTTASHLFLEAAEMDEWPWNTKLAVRDGDGVTSRIAKK